MSVGKVTQTHLTPTEALIIGDVPVRQDAEGRYSLNDLHQAAGGESKQPPALFVRRQETADLMGEINATNSQRLLIELQATGMPVVTMEGRHGGTYVCKELVYAYAIWISLAFQLKIIRAYGALMSVGYRLSEIKPVAAEKEALIYSAQALREEVERCSEVSNAYLCLYQTKFSA